MRRKIIPVLVAIVLIVVIGVFSFGKDFMEKSRYSTERADLDAYFGVSAGRLAIVLQDEMVEEKALLLDGRCYFDKATVDKYFNDGFYVNLQEGVVLYTTALETYKIQIGGTVLEAPDGKKDLGYEAIISREDGLYFEADFLKRFVNCSVDIYDRHVQVYTEWGVRKVDSLTEDSVLRQDADGMSPVLRDLESGEEIEILEEGETWSLAKTSDAFLGYVENKRLKNYTQGWDITDTEKPVTDYTEPEFVSLSMDGKLSLGWHAVYGMSGNDDLERLASEANGMNVIAPTWFSLNDNQGGFRSFASEDYVAAAHGKGLQVWGVWDDFNYGLENPEAGINVGTVLSSSENRQRLVKGISETAISLGLDGVNIDFENIAEEIASHYIQFLRELSVECRKNKLFLSVDNYVPYQYRSYYRLDVQGKIADYVIIMGYDEHWHGSGDPGSVASIEYVRGGISRALEQVPAQKLVNALPFYSIVWKSKGGVVTDEFLTVENVESYVGSHQLTPVWDEETCQNYAEWTEGDALFQVWLEDVDSLRVKLNVMNVQKIGGVAVWQLDFGTPEAWEAIRGFVETP